MMGMVRIKDDAYVLSTSPGGGNEATAYCFTFTARRIYAVRIYSAVNGLVSVCPHVRRTGIN